MNIKKTMLAFAVAASVMMEANASSTFPTLGGDISSIEAWGNQWPISGYGNFNCSPNAPVPVYTISTNFTVSTWSGPAKTGAAAFEVPSELTLQFSGEWRQTANGQNVVYRGNGSFVFGTWRLMAVGTYGEGSKTVVDGTAITAWTLDAQQYAANTVVSLTNGATVSVTGAASIFTPSPAGTVTDVSGNNVFEIMNGSTLSLAKALNVGVGAEGDSLEINHNNILRIKEGTLTSSAAGLTVGGSGNRIESEDGTINLSSTLSIVGANNGIALTGGSLSCPSGFSVGGTSNLLFVGENSQIGCYLSNGGTVGTDGASYNEFVVSNGTVSCGNVSVGSTATSHHNVYRFMGPKAVYNRQYTSAAVFHFGSGHHNEIVVDDHAVYNCDANGNNGIKFGGGSYNTLAILNGSTCNVNRSVEGKTFWDVYTDYGNSSASVYTEGNSIRIEGGSVLHARSVYLRSANGELVLSNGTVTTHNGGSVFVGGAETLTNPGTNVALVINGGENSISSAVTFQSGGKLIVRGEAGNQLAAGALTFREGSSLLVEAGTANTFTTGAISVDSGSAVTFGAGTTNSFASALVVTGTVVTVKGGSVTSLAQGISLREGSKLRFDFTDGAFAAAPIDISSAIGLDDSSSFDYVGIEELQRSIQKPIDIPLIKGANANCFYSFYHNTLPRLISELPAKCSLSFTEGAHQGTLTLHVKPVGLGLSIILR